MDLCLVELVDHDPMVVLGLDFLGQLILEMVEVLILCPVVVVVHDI